MNHYLLSAEIKKDGDYYYILLRIKRRLFGTKLIYLSYWEFFANDDGGWPMVKSFKSRDEAKAFITDIKDGKIEIFRNGFYDDSRRIPGTNFITNS